MLGLLVVLEAGARLYLASAGGERVGRLRSAAAGRDLGAYRLDPHVVYTHRRSTEHCNSLGFLGPEWPASDSPTTKIVCVGASTTESGNEAAYAGSWPFFLQAGIDLHGSIDALPAPVDVINAGMAGWTSAESMLNWFLRLRRYRPEVVVIHHAVNDVAPAMRPDFRADYSHYRRVGDDLWRLPGLAPAVEHSVFAALLCDAAWGDLSLDRLVNHPAPTSRDHPVDGRTARVFAENIEAVLRDASSGGAHVVLMTMPVERSATASDPGLEGWLDGIDRHNAALRELAAAHADASLLDLAPRWEELREQFLDPVHLSPDGNLWKAERLAEHLLRQEYRAR